MSVLNSNSQNEKKVNSDYSLETIKKVVITVNDDLELENAPSDKVECELRFTETGKVIGVSNKDEIEEPGLISEIRDAVLYITPKDRENLYIIGISTYSQDLKYRFKIPSSIPVEIRNTGKCYVNGSFESLKIENEEETDMCLSKNQIKYLNCIASRNTVTLNGADKGKNYFYESDGSDKYIINSKSISIQFK